MTQGATFFIEIAKNSNSNGSSAGEDFMFTGSCFSVHSGSNLPVNSKCTVLDNFTSIKFEYLEAYTGANNFSIRVKVINP